MLNKTKNLKNTFGNDIKVKLKTFQDEQNQTIQNIEEVVFKYVGQLHNWNSELLSEMNDMNQVNTVISDEQKEGFKVLK